MFNFSKIEIWAKQEYPRPPERRSPWPILLWPTSLGSGLPIIIEKLKIGVVRKALEAKNVSTHRDPLMSRYYHVKLVSELKIGFPHLVVSIVCLLLNLTLLNVKRAHETDLIFLTFFYHSCNMKHPVEEKTDVSTFKVHWLR